MLSVWLAPNGDKRKILKVLKTETLRRTEKMRGEHSSLKEGWTFLHTSIVAKLKYPLPAYNFSEKCKSIMFLAKRTALPRSGIASCILVDFKDGPIGDLGAGIFIFVPLYGNI